MADEVSAEKPSVPRRKATLIYRILSLVWVMLPVYLGQLITAIYQGFPLDASEYRWCLLVYVAAILLFALTSKIEVPPIQVHFSTAIILMFTTAIFLWLNLRHRSGWPLDVRFTEKQIVAGKEVPGIGIFRVWADIFVWHISIAYVYRFCERRIRTAKQKAIEA